MYQRQSQRDSGNCSHAQRRYLQSPARSRNEVGSDRSNTTTTTSSANSSRSVSKTGYAQLNKWRRDTSISLETIRCKQPNKYKTSVCRSNSKSFSDYADEEWNCRHGSYTDEDEKFTPHFQHTSRLSKHGNSCQKSNAENCQNRSGSCHRCCSRKSYQVCHHKHNNKNVSCQSQLPVCKNLVQEHKNHKGVQFYNRDKEQCYSKTCHTIDYPCFNPNCLDNQGSINTPQFHHYPVQGQFNTSPNYSNVHGPNMHLLPQNMGTNTTYQTISYPNGVSTTTTYVPGLPLFSSNSGFIEHQPIGMFQTPNVLFQTPNGMFQTPNGTIPQNAQKSFVTPQLIPAPNYPMIQAAPSVPVQNEIGYVPSIRGTDLLSGGGKLQTIGGVPVVVPIALNNNIQHK